MTEELMPYDPKKGKEQQEDEDFTEKELSEVEGEADYYGGEKPLSGRREAFARRYIMHFVASRAAEEAGFAKKSAPHYAHRLKNDIRVKRRIAYLIDQQAKNDYARRDRVIRELCIMAFSNPKDFLELETRRYKYKNGKLVPIAPEKEGGSVLIDSATLKDVPRPLWAAVKRVKNTRYGIELTFHNKIQSLELLGKHLGMFMDPADRPLEDNIPQTDEEWEEFYDKISGGNK